MKARIVLLGPPASGKRTQAEMIRVRHGIPVTSPGAMLRQERNAGMPLGAEADDSVRTGKLLPDRIVNELVEGWFKLQGTRFIFDGHPRSSGQAESLDDMLARRDTRLEVVLALDADPVTLQECVANRLMCTRCGTIVALGWHVRTETDTCPKCNGALVRRADDTPETLATRLREYSEKTVLLLDFYQSRNLLGRILNARTAEAVFAQIELILTEQ